ncbi:hypothetical protein LTR96_011089 [Exophiala xenobiotica]
MTTLTSEYRVHKAAEILGRQFRNVNYGSEALLAPFREADQNGSEIASDGNRRLALLGRSVVETVLLTRWYHTGAERRSADTIINTLASKVAFADLALQNGLDSCVKRSRRQESGIMKPETLKLTITAIIGAIFLDSGFNHGEVEAVMERIG